MVIAGRTTPFRILIIDDDDSVRLLLQNRLSNEGYEVRTANCGRAALALLETSIFDAALLDIQLPDMTGIEILEAIRQRDPEIAAVMMTGYPQLESAIQALRLGAYDYLSKPLDWVPLQHLIERIVERRYLRDEVTNLRSRFAETPPLGELIGSSAPIQKLKETIAKVAATESVVLIEGESGTGKELVAYAIHRLSGRSKGPFVAVNCAAIPAELMESELFGHVKGAFSSATANAQGLFRSAERGTLLLDEIGDLPLPMQPKLLRVLQEREVRAVGSPHVHHVDVRVVAATNQNLDAAVQSGKFRQDLFFRLNVVRIQPPSLRSVKEDITPLAMHMIRKLNRKFGRHVQSIAPDAMAALRAYDFPGNVRELENIIERAYALGADDQITIADLPSLSYSVSPSARPKGNSPLEDLERDFIVETLQVHGDDKLKTSKALGMSERTLYRRLKDIRKRSQAGVSIIETLVACLILVVLSLSVISLIIASIATNNRNKIDSTQTMLAESILEQIHSTFNGSGTSSLQDCSGTDWTIDTTIPNTGSVGSALLGSSINFVQATPPAGYHMDYVVRTPCDTTGNIVGTYDVRWHLDQIGTTNTYLITVGARLKDHGEGDIYFALPVTLRFMAGS